MVESSAGGGSCHCTCQEEEYSAQEDTPRQCCSPQVFTSILLGMLACVLMTGGVFLAFHRWDPLWLIVSGVGIILILIGSILHCCSSRDSTSRRQSSSGGKGCCGGRPVQAGHLHGHLVTNNGSLTEQLLPLSNARSVSQLSLNMLPGYFPPVVTTYGIEQHSAVVQNINRLVQQQQPQSPGSASPGVANGAGKSFILLSLPGDATQANIQNLVATVYQLDGNVIAETPTTEVPPPTPAASNATFTSTPAPPLILKNVEVQTCSVWNNPASNSVPALSSDNLSNPSTTNASNERTNSPPELPRPSQSTASGGTQTEDPNPSTTINLMDLSPELPSVCDSLQGISDIPPSNLSNIPMSLSTVLVDVSETPVSAGAVTIPESSTNLLLNLPTTVVLCGAAEDASPADAPIASTDVLIDIQNNVVSAENVELPSEPIVSNISSTRDSFPVVQDLQEGTVTSSVQSEEIGPDADQPLPGNSNSELSLNCSNLSDIDGEADDNELPPSYDDVAHEGESAVGAFGLAYGTI